MRRLVAAGIVVLAGALAPVAPGAVLAVHATLDDSTVQFGEAIATHVVVLVDRTRVRPDSVRVVEDPGPLTVLAHGGTTRTTQGDTVVLAIARSAVCVSAACVAARGEAVPSLPRVLVTARTLDGRTLHAQAVWPALHVRGRVGAADLARTRPPFRIDSQPSPPSYRIRPSLLTALFLAAAAVLALAAIAIAVPVLLRRKRRRTVSEDALVRAVRLTREAESRSAVDRRRAVGLLARLLAVRDRRLAAFASDLAWAKPAPESDALAALADDVEREVTR